MWESAMAHPQQASVRNRLLAALTPDAFWLLQPHLEPVPLGLRQWVIETQQPIQHVTFPEHGIISVLADTSQGRIEVGLIGPEGMAGLPVVLGIDHSPYGYMVQAEGEALRIPAQDLRTATRPSPSLHAGFLRYAHALMVQTAQTAYANAGFTMEARLARWVLMTDDRLVLLRHKGWCSDACLGIERGPCPVRKARRWLPMTAVKCGLPPMLQRWSKSSATPTALHPCATTARVCSCRPGARASSR